MTTNQKRERTIKVKNVAEAEISAGSSVRTEKDKGLRLALVTVGIAIALALAASLLRLYRLAEVPPGIYLTEGIHGVNALQVLQGEHAVFFPDDYGRAGMIIYAVALTTSFLGRTMLAVRLPAALASTGTVLAVFWLGNTLFGRDERGRSTPWRGLLIGGVSAGLLAVSIAQVVLGRTAFRGNFLPLLLCLCLALLWRGWRERSRWGIVLAGVCAGLLPYTYTPSRFVPFLFLLFSLSFLLPLGNFTREKAHADLPWAGLFLGVTALVAAPILIHFAVHPDHFFMRSNQLLVLRPDHGLAASLAAFGRNAWDHLLSFGFRGDPNMRHNFPGQPLLNPYEAFFFWLGVGMTLLRWRSRPAYRLLFLWLGILLLPAMLSRDRTVPHFLRMIGAAPAVYLLAGVGLWESFSFLKERYSRESESRPVVLVAAVAGALILAQGVMSFHTYFERWVALPEMADAYDLEWMELARVLNGLPSAADAAYLVPTFHSPYSFQYLYQGKSPAHLLHPSAPGLAQKVESALRSMESLSNANVLQWNAGVSAVGEDTGRFAFLLSKYGRYQGSEEYPDFHLHNYTDISLDRSWRFYEELEPLTVDYDGGIALQGLALGQGPEQMSAQGALEIGRDRPMWMAMRWQIAPELDVDYAISLRLYSSGGERVFQEDTVLRNPLHQPTSDWSGEAPVDTTGLLTFPADLPAGNYKLRMVVYDFETLAPTVEIGVWEAETTLARLRLAENR